MSVSDASPATAAVCVNCGQPPGVGRTCRVCNQVTGMTAGLKVAGGGKRFGAHVLDGVLAVVTLGIGWLIWSMIVWKGGRTPAKQLLGMRCIKTKDLQPSGWWRTAARELILKTIIFGIPLVGWVLAFWLLWDDDRQELWDKMAGTLVVDQPKGVGFPVPEAAPAW
jgi:uncharacterized RDD family membrane protein YckC